MAFLGAVGKFLGSNIMPILGLGAGVGSQAANIRMQQRANEQSQAFSKQMFDAQGQREIQYFNMQNAYNDPSSQMQRLRDAGLNPNLVYGNGATTQSASISPKAPMSAQFQAPKLDMGSVVQQALLTQQLQSNIRRTDAETQAIESRTVNQDFMNKVQQSIGVDQYMRNYNLATQELSSRSQKSVDEYEAWKVANFNAQGVTQGGFTIDANSPIVKAQRAGIEQALQSLQNMKLTGDAIGFQNVVKAFEANLAKQGISPNSPWWTKLVGDLLMKAIPSLQSGMSGFQAPATTNFNPQ
nr:MAG: DNA pilot protein [Microvirus sp.]